MKEGRGREMQISHLLLFRSVEKGLGVGELEMLVSIKLSIRAEV